MTNSTAADRQARLTDDLLLEERIAFLLQRANRRQFWMIFLDDDDVQIGPLMPNDGLPSDPGTLVDTEDLGSLPIASLLGHRIADLMGEFGFTQAVFVWERRGGPSPHREERMWAQAIARACAVRAARVRAQFLLHDEGVRPLTPDDYLDAAFTAG